MTLLPGDHRGSTNKILRESRSLPGEERHAVEKPEVQALTESR